MSVYISVSLRQQLREKFANCCAYCRSAESLTVETFEYDHCIPQSAGGKTIFENLCLCCSFCNAHKSNRQTVIDPDTQEGVLLFNPQLQNWNEHFAWSEDSSTIVGLTAIGRATVAVLQMNRPQLVRLRQMWAKLGEHPPLL